MTRFAYVELAISLSLYLLLGYQILTGKIKQSFATWILWAILDAIAAASLIYQHGNFAAVLIYTFGGIAISLCILKSKNFTWKRFETLLACMAGLCMVIWAVSGPRNATIASTAAVAIATFPLLRDAYKLPHESSFTTWVGFSVVNVLAIADGKNWSVQERLYPATCTVLCFALVVLTARKFWLPKPEVP